MAVRLDAGDLEVTAIGKEFAPDSGRVVISQSEADDGGSTSVRNTDKPFLKWKHEGYYQRNRDLGQVFTVDHEFLLDAIVLRTGPSDAAVLAGAPGERVFVQFYEVVGEPRIHNNDTPSGTEAKHGFSKNHRCDDYLTGVEYRPLTVVTGGRFPDLPPTRDMEGKPTGDDSGRMAYMRWKFAGPEAPRFEAGKRYAFMIGFDKPGRERGFTLANTNAAGVDSPPSLNDQYDRYAGGWGLRREGDGALPPSMFPGPNPPADPRKQNLLEREALFEKGEKRHQLAPTTDGFPDVDTYRDLEFYLEAVVDSGDPASEG